MMIAAAALQVVTASDTRNIVLSVISGVLVVMIVAGFPTFKRGFKTWWNERELMRGRKAAPGIPPLLPLGERFTTLEADTAKIQKAIETNGSGIPIGKLLEKVAADIVNLHERTTRATEEAVATAHEAIATASALRLHVDAVAEDLKRDTARLAAAVSETTVQTALDLKTASAELLDAHGRADNERFEAIHDILDERLPPITTAPSKN